MKKRRSKLNPVSMTRIEHVASKKCWKETKTTKYIKEIKEQFLSLVLFLLKNFKEVKIINSDEFEDILI